MRKTSVAAKPGSGNVFADLGLPNPEQERLKAHLTLQIHRIVKERGLARGRAGQILGVEQPQLSALMRNRAGNLPVERLMEFLTALGHDVEITVKPARSVRGEMTVVTEPLQEPSGRPQAGSGGSSTPPARNARRVWHPPHRRTKVL